MKLLLAALIMFPCLAFADASALLGTYKVLSFQYSENDMPAGNANLGTGIQILMRSKMVCVYEMGPEGLTQDHCFEQGSETRTENIAGDDVEITETGIISENVLDYSFTLAGINDPVYREKHLHFEKKNDQYTLTISSQESNTDDNYSESHDYVLQKN